MAGMSSRRRNVILVQLPIPPLGPEAIRGNVPLAAAYLKLYASGQGLERAYDIDIFPAALANTLGDRALVRAILDREPWLVGFTCYVWNIERTLWIAQELKACRPEVRIVLGGPEITPDNAWVLRATAYDYAVIGEGEQTFAELLHALAGGSITRPIAGLYVRPTGREDGFDPALRPSARTPMPDLNRLGSPYLAGILDAADEEMLLLETTRGCVFKCKFCYYPKSYDGQYYLAPENVLANLAHARERGAREVFLLDPTLNQRKDFASFLRLLAQGNPGCGFTYFGELRAEGIAEQTAALLAEANFTEVEVGLQSIDATAQERMDRKNNLRAFERGVRAMLAEGIRVKVDLIVGLPGDTVESIRAGFRFLLESGLYSDVQVFNLSILPGTAFREEAQSLGLSFQPRPPYYVLGTPTLRRQDLYGLIHEAQTLFETEFDAAPAPVLDFGPGDECRVWRVDLDRGMRTEAPPGESRAQAFTLWLRSAHFDESALAAAGLVRQVLDANPFTTLQVVLEPLNAEARGIPETLSRRTLDTLSSACNARPTYLDWYYALQPGRPNGAKRLVIALPEGVHADLDARWVEEVEPSATLVCLSPNTLKGQPA
jgi:radical SAM superfamily enzyme YgiQ (UPF0313 family)